LVKSIHKRVRLQIAQKNEKFASQANNGRRRVIFEPGVWVWVHMRKERFPTHRRTKLHPRDDGPFQILEKINDNAYKVDLPGEYNVSATFNVSDLSPYDAGDRWANHKVNGEEDQGSNARIDAIHLGRVCKFIEQDPNIQDGLERRRINFNSCDTSDRWGQHSLVVSCKLFISLSIGMWANFLCFYDCRPLGLFVSLSGLLLLAIEV